MHISLPILCHQNMASLFCEGQRERTSFTDHVLKAQLWFLFGFLSEVRKERPYKSLNAEVN